MVIVMSMQSLYSYVLFCRVMFAYFVENNMVFILILLEPDVYMHDNMKFDETAYFELIIFYVDYCHVVGLNTKEVM